MNGGVSTPLILGLPFYLCGGTAGGTPASKTFTVDDPIPANVTTIRFNSNGVYGFDQRGLFKSLYVGCAIALVSTRGEANIYTLTSVFVGTSGQGMLFGVSILQISGVNFSGNYTVVALPGALLFNPGWPTSDPHVVGQIWTNAGLVTISAG